MYDLQKNCIFHSSKFLNVFPKKSFDAHFLSDNIFLRKYFLLLESL